MSVRSAIDNGIQIGDESTPGTQVAGDKKLTTLDIEWGPNLVVQEWRAAGRKYAGASVVHGIDMRGNWSAILDYNALVYPFGGYVGAVITTPSGGTNSRKWAITPAMTGRDANQKTFTVERGDSAAAQVATFVQFNSIQADWSRSDSGAALNFSGSVFGRKLADGQTLTSSPTTVSQKPASAPQIKIYADTSFANIGTTLVASAYAGGFNLGEKYVPFYAFDGTDTMADTAEKAPPVSFNFKTAHNAQSRGFFSNLSANSTYFVRYLVEGATIEGSIKETFKLDICGRFAQAQEDKMGGVVYGYSYQLNGIEDSTFNSTGGIWLAEIINTLTAY